VGATALVLIAMAVGVVAAILYPLLVGAGRDRRVTQGPSEIDALLRRKATLYSNMKDLEFEFRMGKLAEADYSRLHEEDRAEAARILIEIDALEDRNDADAIIEREIAARIGGEAAPRPSPSGVAREPSGVDSQTARPSPRFCAQCGARVGPGDRFCAQCGHTLAAGSSA